MTTDTDYSGKIILVILSMREVPLVWAPIDTTESLNGALQ